MPHKAIYVGQWDQQWDQQWALQSMCFVCACPVVSVTVLFQAGCSQHCPHSQHMCRFQKVNYFSLKTCLWQFLEINMHKTAQVQLFPQKHFQHTHTHFSLWKQALATPLMDPENPILFGGWQSWNGWCWWTWTFSSGWQEWIPCYVMLCNFFPLPEDLEGTPEGQAIATVKVRVLRNLHERYVGPLGGSIFKLMVDQLGYKGLQKSDWYYNSIPVYDIGNQLAG